MDFDEALLAHRRLPDTAEMRKAWEEAVALAAASCTGEESVRFLLGAAVGPDVCHGWRFEVSK